MRYKLLLLLIVVTNVFSQNAILDNSFGINGKVTTSFDPAISKIKSLEIQSDGKIIACGLLNIPVNSVNVYRTVLVRYNSDGSLDRSFGTNGFVIIDQFNNSFFDVMRLQSDGRIIIAGQVEIQGTQSVSVRAAVQRYNPDGTLDTGFGVNGSIIGVITNILGSASLVTDVIIQSNSKILVAIGGGNNNLKIMRFDFNGYIDMSFGINGIFELNLGSNSLTQSKDFVSSIGLNTSGDIILSGYTDVGNIPEEWDGFLAKLNENGILDTTFGTNGFITTNFYEKDYISSLIISNNSIITTGLTLDSNNNSKIILAKYTSDGSLDSSFDLDGKVITQTNSLNLYDTCWDSKIQSDGKIVCFGQNGLGLDIFGGLSQQSEMLLLRYGLDGSLDTSFSPLGYFTIFFDANVYNNGEAIVIQNDGKIIIGGSSNTSFALARYTFENLATNSFSNEKRLSFFPNPANDYIILDKEITSIKVYSIEGKKIEVNYLNNKLDISSLKKGIFFIVGKNDAGKSFENILIKN